MQAPRTLEGGVQVRAMRVRLGANEVLRGIDLEVAEGEFLVLLGPSGCGKSTLLHAIAGLLPVQEGSVTIGGRDVTAADPADRNIGMVFQSYALYPTMDVERNLSFGLRVRGTPRAVVAERVARVARMLQLEPLLRRRPAAHRPPAAAPPAGSRPRAAPRPGSPGSWPRPGHG